MPELLDIFKAALLGIVEGLTEFIPVSSTAHLILASYLLNFRTINNNSFEIIIQIGAILAVCTIYRQKIFDLFINFKDKSRQKFILNLSLSFLPAAVIGAAFHTTIKRLFFTNITIAIALIIGGILMIVIEQKPQKTVIKDLNQMKPFTAFRIGLFQCLAMIPGVSRSGASIIGGLLLGLNRKIATEFSFLLAIPTIAAASFYDLVRNLPDLTKADFEIIFIGLITSFFSAILVIKWFINFISKNSFTVFGFYRIIAGILVLLLIV